MSRSSMSRRLATQSGWYFKGILLGHTRGVPGRHGAYRHLPRAVRLRALQRLASRAEDHGDLHLMLKVLDQAAREVADVYSQRRQIDGKQEDEATARRDGRNS